MSATFTFRICPQMSSISKEWGSALPTAKGFGVVFTLCSKFKCTAGLECLRAVLRTNLVQQRE